MSIASADLICGVCRYNLRDIPSSRCPECGTSFDRNHLISDLVPWEQRRYIWAWRAFPRTIWMASAHPRQLAEKIDRPMNDRAARVFALLIVTLTAGGWVAAACAIAENAQWFTSNWRLRPPESWVFLLNPFALGASCAALIAWHGAAIAITRRFFRA